MMSNALGLAEELGLWRSRLTLDNRTNPDLLLLANERRRSAPACGARNRCRSAAREVERGNGMGSTQP